MRPEERNAWQALAPALVAFLMLAGCSMFADKAKNNGREDAENLRSDVIRTGMAPIEVERLLGKPDSISTGPCSLEGQPRSCQIWRYTKKRQSTLWFSSTSSATRLELFDLEALR